MELKFKRKENTTSGLVTWLKGFKDVQPSLLLEVDVVKKEFIAKSFPPEKLIVKYSKISFDEAGVELLGMFDNNGVAVDPSVLSTITSTGRVCMGIYTVLSKAIDVISMFSDVEHEITITFDLCQQVMYLRAKGAEPEYEATAMVLKSATLKMVISCAQLSEFFEKCNDDTFLNKVCNVSSPSVFEISSDAIQNLGKISVVFAGDKSRDSIKFYSKEENGKLALYALDNTNMRYDYLLGYHVGGELSPTEICIFRENFMTATKGLVGDAIRFTLDTAGASRMLIETDDSKIVVAAVKQ